MTIDERIEALTHTVELLASFHRDHEKRMDEMEKKWDERLGKMLDIVERLDRMIQIHDARLNGHDDRLDDLERGKG